MLALWKPSPQGLKLTLVSSGKKVRDNCIGDDVAIRKAESVAHDKLYEERRKEYSKPGRYPPPGLIE